MRRNMIMRPIERFEDEAHTHRTYDGKVYHLTRTWIVLQCGHRLLKRNAYYKTNIGDERHCVECEKERHHHA